MLLIAIPPILCSMTSCMQETAWENNMTAGDLQFKQRHYGEAAKDFSQARQEAEKFAPEDDRRARTLERLADTYVKERRYTEAESLYKQVLAAQEKTAGPTGAGVAESLNRLGKMYYLQFEDYCLSKDFAYEETRKLSESLLKRALAIREKAFGPDHPAVAESLSDLADVYRDYETDKADPLYRRALAIREKTLGVDHPDLASTLSGLATVCLRQRKVAEAERFAERALAINEKRLDPYDSELAASLIKLGEVYTDQRNYMQGEAMFKRALAIEKKNVDVPDVYKLSESHLENLYDDRDLDLLQKPFTTGAYQYIPDVKEGFVRGFRLLKNGKTIFSNDLAGDYHHSPGNVVEMVDNSSAYATKSIVFPLANARIKNEFDPNGKDNLSLTDDRLTRLLPINDLFSRPYPGLIVGTFSGGANSCCTDYELFSLGGDKVTKLPSLEGRDVYRFTFGDFHGDGRHQQAIGNDMTFVYWNAPRPNSPTPGVVLDYSPSGWHLSSEDMRLASIPAEKIGQAIAICKTQQQASEKAYPPEEGEFALKPCVWATMLNLIYAGQANEAWRFLDQVWPEGKISDQQDEQGNRMDKAQFVRSFKSQLHESPYWHDLVKLNKGQQL